MCIRDSSTGSPWSTEFRDEFANINNDPRPGRLKVSTDEQSVKLVADFLQEHCHVTMYGNVTQTIRIPPTAVF